MTIQLPEDYLRRMKRMLGDRFESFIASYEEPRAWGLRLNTRKLTPQSPACDQLRALFQLEPVAWCPSGYYYNEETRPGRHPFHAAGVYYIQEPSAMSAAELLDSRPGDIVLDLAAAPGGKSTQIADHLQGQGLLISNEIHPARASILSENIERMGIRNAVVTNASPGHLAQRFPHFFDRIMVDAPCSGEGMFRKEPETIGEWSEAQVANCAARQRDILRDAVRMLKPGGTLAYSTCTFNEEENEETIAWLIAACPELSLVRMERFWPHERRGEGHFVAVLQHGGADEADEADKAQQAVVMGEADHGGRTRRRPKPSGQVGKALQEAMALFEAFAEATLSPSFTLPDGEPLLFGEQLYWLPTAGGRMSSAMLAGLKVPRPGLHLGTVRKNRFEPSHALALAIRREDARTCVDHAADSAETSAYLRGETLSVPCQLKGWTLVTVDGFPLGWGKASGGVLKNHYPKGLRRPN